MMFTRFHHLPIGLGLLLAVSSCTPVPPEPLPTPPPLLNEPIGVQVQRVQPSLSGMPFRVLLDFEKPLDLAFISPSGLSLSPSAAHTGRSSLVLPTNQRELSVRLSSLLGETAFPGSWTLAVAYFKSDKPARVTAVCRNAQAGPPLAQHAIELKPGQWTGVWLDLGKVQSNNTPKALQFTISGDSVVYCDDLILANNERTLEAPALSSPKNSGWTIHRRGFNLTLERPLHFKITALSPEAAADGWACEEANEIRARLVSEAGKTWTIYSDGRQYLDGKCSLLFNPSGASMARSFAEQHANPANLEVPEEFGRVDQHTQGDRLNDGYNELRGAYQFVARGPRFEVKIAPRGAALIRPVLEIARIPPGKVLATVDGQLIERTARLADGSLLVELPITIGHPMTVNVSVK